MWRRAQIRRLSKEINSGVTVDIRCASLTATGRVRPKSPTENEGGANAAGAHFSSRGNVARISKGNRRWSTSGDDRRACDPAEGPISSDFGIQKWRFDL